MNHDISTQQEINIIFRETLRNLDNFILKNKESESIKVESLLNAFVTIYSELKNLNNNKPIHEVKTEDFFADRLWKHLSTINDILKKNRSKIIDLDEDLKSQEAEIKKLNDEIMPILKSLSKKSEVLKNDREIYSQRKSEESCLLEEINNNEKFISNLNTPETGDIDVLKKKNADLKDELTSLEQERTTLDKEQTKLEQEKADAIDNEKEIRARINEIIEKTEYLNNDIIGLQNEQQEKSNGLKRFENEKICLQEEISNIEKSINNLNTPETGDIDVLKKKNADLKDELTSLEQERTTLDEEQIRLEHDKEEVFNIKKETKSDIDNLETDIKQLNEEIPILKNEKQEKETRLKRLQEELAALSSEALDKLLKDSCEEAEVFLNVWKAFISDSEVTEFEKESTNTEKQLHSVYNQVSDNVKKLEELTSKQLSLYREFLPMWEERYKKQKDNK